MTGPAWDKRIQRAEELAGAYPFAAEVLRFYQQVAGFQKDLYAHIVSASGGRQLPLSPEKLNLIVLLPRFSLFLSLIQRVGSDLLARLAGELRAQGDDRWRHFLTAYWTGDTGDDFLAENPTLFFARAFLQPYAASLALQTKPGLVDAAPRICPVCGRRPQLGVLRPEGQGAKRSLLCSLCLTEWDYRRLVCPACEEEDIDKLTVYTAPQFAHLRLEACDSCKTYINTVDLTKNGLAVPEVDELAALPLSLWAQEHGYTKRQPNLLGI